METSTRKKREAEAEQQEEALMLGQEERSTLQYQLELAMDRIEDLLDWQQRAQEILNQLPPEMLEQTDRSPAWGEER